MHAFNPKVSIVIPVFNGENFLKEAINSALNQSYENIEVIVVNDGSTDQGNTEAIAKSYGSSIKYISKINGGVASALNCGIGAMSGEYFSWLSHDDLYQRDKIKKQIEFLSLLPSQLRNTTVVYSNCTFYNTTSNAEYTSQLSEIKYSFRLWITMENTLHGCTLLIPSNAFKDHGQFNEKLKTTQDYDMWFRIAQSYDFKLINNSLVTARIHPNQDSIKKQSIAHYECDILLSNFVNSLDKAEFHSFNRNINIFPAYIKLFLSMHRRAFYLSRSRVIVKFIEHTNLIYPKSGLKMLKKISKYIKSNFSNQSDNGPSNFFSNLNLIPLRDKFTKVYRENIFEGVESLSGRGSNLIQTSVIRDSIPELIDKLSIKSMVDAPCGDWFWMKRVDLSKIQYTGLDIVPDLIEKNNTLYKTDLIQFQCKNIVEEIIPKADLIFCRDCLVHLSYGDSKKILSNFKKSGSKYLLTTTFTDRAKNEDLGNGFWRPINLELYPFNFPKPLEIINENCTEGDGNYTDKSLGLWLLDDL